MNDPIEPIKREASTQTGLHRTTLVGIAVFVVLIAIAWHVTYHPFASPSDGKAGSTGLSSFTGGNASAPVSVGVAVAQLRAMPRYVDALGTVTPVSTVNVKAQVSGVLTQVLYQEGQLVHAGQVLTLIEPRAYEMALQQATGQRQRDEAQLALARMTLQRDRSLRQKDAIAEQDLDVQAALVKQLEGTVVSDLATEGVAKLNLAHTRIEAPVSGRVGLRTVDAGNVVSPGDANGVAVITQMAPIDVVFAVPQDMLADVMASGDRQAHGVVMALDRSLNQVLDQGVFTTIDNQIDTQSGTVRAKARFTNAHAHLFPHQFVNVRMSLPQSTTGIVVPASAVRAGPNGDIVYVLKADQTVAAQPVSKGQTIGNDVPITTGLKAGDKVVTDGADRLRDGAHVLVQQ